MADEPTDIYFSNTHFTCCQLCKKSFSGNLVILTIMAAGGGLIIFMNFTPKKEGDTAMAFLITGVIGITNFIITMTIQKMTEFMKPQS